MVVINGLDTNDQSGRADLRKQGYFIDNSGVYAPGSGSNNSSNGKRVGDTWGASGGFANGAAQANEKPNDVFLPLQNGTPMSPSNAKSYDVRMPGVSYIGDSNFASLFGPGSYFTATGGPNHYGWMGNAGSATDPQSFMQAIYNYAQMAATNNVPQNPLSPFSGGPSGVQPGARGGIQMGQSPNYSAANTPVSLMNPVEGGAAANYFNSPVFTNAMQRMGLGH
jgi:hypothetical protein